MKVIEKNPGRKIEYEASGTKLFLGDDEIMLNLAKYQKDWPVHLDVCCNRDEMLMVGTGDGLYYVAQIDIPEIQYKDVEEGAESGSTPLPLDMKKVVLTLWSLDELTPSPIEEN